MQDRCNVRTTTAKNIKDHKSIERASNEIALQLKQSNVNKNMFHSDPILIYLCVCVFVKCGILKPRNNDFRSKSHICFVSVRAIHDAIIKRRKGEADERGEEKRP